MEKVPPKRRNAKGATKEELLKLDKDELIERIHQLEAHNFQLKNIIQKKQPTDPKTTFKEENRRPFNFSKCHSRRVLLRVLYFGWDFQGLAVQEDSTETIEHHLFNALNKTCLIESRDTSGYHRCGRTDKGVSSFGQVISITLRSKFPPDQQLDPANIEDEIPYCKLLNRLLPEGIRAVAWMPIPGDRPEYSARFDCKQRRYRYYFPRGNLNLAAMRAASGHLVGSHDFRNLCKMDVGNGVTEFVRRVHSAAIVAVDEGDTAAPTSMYYLQIEGNAFLWHQIRCIFGVLILVGQGREDPQVVRELFDVETNPCKPQYSMALDVPLNLFHCTYELERDSRWVCERDEMRLLVAQLQAFWTMHSVKSTMIKDCLQSLVTEFKSVIEQPAKIERSQEKNTILNEHKKTKLGTTNEDDGDGIASDPCEKEDGLVNGCERDADTANLKQEGRKEKDGVTSETNEKEEGQTNGSEREEVIAYADCLLQGVKSKIYKPLLKRDMCSSLEERIEYYKKRRKVDQTTDCKKT